MKYIPINFQLNKLDPLSVETEYCGQLENSPVGYITLFYLVGHWTLH